MLAEVTKGLDFLVLGHSFGGLLASNAPPAVRASPLLIGFLIRDKDQIGLGEPQAAGQFGAPWHVALAVHLLECAGARGVLG